MAHRQNELENNQRNRHSVQERALPSEFDSGETQSAPAAPIPTGHINTELAIRAAQSDCTILITGETGVGKGHLARWLHKHSRRETGPYIPVNCGAIPDTLIDSQLFGHTKGSFSGATADHIGLVRAAENGTLLLDEVSELPPTAQLRLLRLLQEREVQPIGHPKPIIVNVRVIAATNISLDEAITTKTFREDLYFRLNVIQLEVPPLRERREQIPQLLNVFNTEFAELYQQDELTFDDDVLQTITAYHWPGNIRELRTVVERLHVLCPGAKVNEESLRIFGKLKLAESTPEQLRDLEELKRDQVEKIMIETGGSIAQTATVLGVHRSTIYRWLNRTAATASEKN